MYISKELIGQVGITLLILWGIYTAIDFIKILFGKTK